MPKRINDAIADRFTEHSIDIERFTRGEVFRLAAILRELEDDLAGQIARVDPSAPARTAFQEARVAKLSAGAKATIASAYRKLAGESRKGLTKFAAVEAEAATAVVNQAAGFELLTHGLGPDLARSLADRVAIEGAPLKEWWARQNANTLFRFRREMRQGVLQGEALDDLVARVRGKRGVPGIMDVARRDAETLVRTSTIDVANKANQEAFERNADVIKAVQQRSTLDSRTTNICKAYAGKAWTIPDYQPIDHDLPWNGGPARHPRCRSVAIPVTRSWSELTAGDSEWQAKVREIENDDLPSPAEKQRRFEQQLRRDGFTEAEIKRARLNVRASMDGQVSRDMDFGRWLETKSESFQRGVLGPGRYELWKAKKISLGDLVDASGQRELTIDQLSRKVAARKAAATRRRNRKR